MAVMSIWAATRVLWCVWVYLLFIAEDTKLISLLLMLGKRQLMDHLRGIATDLWASGKLTQQFRSIQAAFGHDIREFIYAPSTRWMEIRKVCERYILVLGDLDMVYEQRAVAQGRLTNIRKVPLIFLS